jgi:hypothetical protein
MSYRCAPSPDFIGLQFGLVGFVLAAGGVVGRGLDGVAGILPRRRHSHSAVDGGDRSLRLFFFWKSLSLRVGDTWPMFMWPPVCRTAINIAMLPREGFPAWMIRSTISWANIAIVSASRLLWRLSLLCRQPLEFHRQDRSDRWRGRLRAGADRAQAELQKIGATWIATTDYRTYAMLRWYFNGRVPVIQINERGRFMGFRDPGMAAIRGPYRALCRARTRQSSPLWIPRPAIRQPLATGRPQLARHRHGYLCTGKTDGWTPELSPPTDSPLYRWRVLAGDFQQPLRGGAVVQLLRL